MSIESVASRLVQLCREGKFNEAQEELYAANVRSIEMEQMATGPLGSASGFEAIREKARRFDESVSAVHSITVSEPLIAAPFFTFVLGLDATFKEGGRRVMNEICVYETLGDKIVREQFFYATG
jgi:hypothetical protein